jgi:hypothetical protein
LDPETGFEIVPPGISRSFLRPAKALGNLNDITRRDKEKTVKWTAQHLRQVRERNVTEDFDASLSNYYAVIEEQIADGLARSKERFPTELLGLLVSGIRDSVIKLEENERLRSCVSVEKKDAIMPCSGHPVVDANEEQVRKAHFAMSKIFATVNRGPLLNLRFPRKALHSWSTCFVDTSISSQHTCCRLQWGWFKTPTPYPFVWFASALVVVTREWSLADLVVVWYEKWSAWRVSARKHLVDDNLLWCGRAVNEGPW